MREKDSNLRHSAYEADGLAAALSRNIARSSEELPGVRFSQEKKLSMYIIKFSII